MIEEQFVTLETAKLLKEKGFNETCLAYYKNNMLVAIYEDCHDILPATNTLLDKISPKNECYSAPTQQMAMRWLREVHNLCISIILDGYVDGCDPLGYYIAIDQYGAPYHEVSPTLIDRPDQVFFKTYEEALEAAIKYVMQALI